MGYSLLPITFLASMAIITQLKNGFGYAFSILILIWSTYSATRLFEYTLEMENKKYLIAYPIMLFYFVFMLLTMY